MSTSFIRGTSVRRQLGVVLLGLLIAVWLVSPLSAEIAQSIFRFRAKPEFMLLSVQDDSPEILGFTVSLWNRRYESVVVGTRLGNGIIKLSFYPYYAYQRALEASKPSITWSRCKPVDYQWPALFDGSEGVRPFSSSAELRKLTWNSNRPNLSDQECFKTIASLITNVRAELIQKGTFSFIAKEGKRDDSGHIPGEWVAREIPQDSGGYSSFRLEQEYGIGRGAQSKLTGETAFRKIGFERPAPSSLRDLLLDKLFPISGGGLPPVKTEVFKTNCSSTDISLPSLLQAAGRWEVRVNPDGFANYLVELKSHSDHEFFYRDGYWWKAAALVRFSSSDGVTCSRAEIFLYDSLVCAAPIDKDPDQNQRSICFQRILDADSKAEFDLRERLRLTIQRAYGRP